MSDKSMMEALCSLPDAVGNMTYGDPDEPDSVNAADAVRWAIQEIERLQLKLLAEQERDEPLATYSGDGQTRHWWSGGAWLYPGCEVVIRYPIEEGIEQTLKAKEVE